MTNTDYAAKAFINRQKRLNQVKRHKIALIVFFYFFNYCIYFFFDRGK